MSTPEKSSSGLPVSEPGLSSAAASEAAQAGGAADGDAAGGGATDGSAAGGSATGGGAADGGAAVGGAAVGGAAVGGAAVGGAAVGGATGEGAAASGARRSGLRNPAAAVRGLGAGTLTLEAIVLLLAIQPIRVMGGHLGGWGIGAVVALAVLAILLAGMMRRPWAWSAGTVLQVLLLASGLFHWSLTVVGLIFTAAWGYALYVRRTILG